ncbi:MAG TPA: cobyrinate a,c-diamide synthase [Solirubrobacterales bacterium]|nr:cobyrinate a,c-diamide synthase [Solirubrobacterales bacterium]
MNRQQAHGGGFIVSGTHSGAGKTTVTVSLIRQLREAGVDVQPFKLGPDFIDTAYLSQAAGRRAINLDLWMMGAEGVRRSFRTASEDADIAVIEAMGALHDGTDGTGHGSAAHLAKLLGLPILIVVDVAGMTRTAAAILTGLIAFDPAVEIAGIVLNRVGSSKHAEMVMQGLPRELRELVWGAIPRDDELEISERHLGLLTVEENDARRSSLAAAHRRAGGHLDIQRAVRLGRNRASKESKTPQPELGPTARLAIARDRAFCFYYEENLRRLSEAGFELVPFQPTVDRRLPPDVDAAYIGGGYPESFAAELAANRSLAEELRARTAAGMPLYAECGGLLYLARSLTGFDGSRHEMAGVLPLDIAMDREYLAISYVKARTTTSSPLGPAGTEARGQEFHQSRVTSSEIDAALYELTASDGQTRRDGFVQGSVVASYVHLHFASAPEVPTALAEAAKAA